MNGDIEIYIMNLSHLRENLGKDIDNLLVNQLGDCYVKTTVLDNEIWFYGNPGKYLILVEKDHVFTRDGVYTTEELEQEHNWKYSCEGVPCPEWESDYNFSAFKRRLGKEDISRIRKAVKFIVEHGTNVGIYDS